MIEFVIVLSAKLLAVHLAVVWAFRELCNNLKECAAGQRRLSNALKACAAEVKEVRIAYSSKARELRR